MLFRKMKAVMIMSMILGVSTTAMADSDSKGPKFSAKVQTYFGQYTSGAEAGGTDSKAHFVNKTEANFNIKGKKGNISALFELEQRNYEGGKDKGKKYVAYNKDQLTVQMGFNEGVGQFVSKSGTKTSGLKKHAQYAGLAGPDGDGLGVHYKVNDDIKVSGIIYSEDHVTDSRDDSGMTTQLAFEGGFGPLSIVANLINGTGDDYKGSDGKAGESVSGSQTLVGAKYKVNDGISVSLDYAMASVAEYTKSDASGTVAKDDTTDLALQLKAAAGPGKAIVSYITSENKSDGEKVSTTNYLSFVYDIKLEKKSGFQIVAQQKTYKPETGDSVTASFYGAGLYTKF